MSACDRLATLPEDVRHLNPRLSVSRRWGYSVGGKQSRLNSLQTMVECRGALPSARMQSYLRLRAEAEAAELRRSPQQLGNAKKRWKSIHKNAKALNKISGKWK